MNELDRLKTENADLKRQLEEQRLKEADTGQMTKQEIVARLNKMTADFNQQLEEWQKQGKLCNEKRFYFKLMGFLLKCCWCLVKSI
ncbi:hypothetical protein [Megasphaera sp.]|uniref:hypothetical protein n=1 Tax=Megasphaera sp. TaxID=2023260 RepID=UPI0025BB532E|nr:hypothetical protein [Megasphaera sp.]MCF0154006.1 hypothetical protein [Megasphaera sp.]MCF0256485.1 hypothetical protein [Bacteroides heparinolyticus]